MRTARLLFVLLVVAWIIAQVAGASQEGALVIGSFRLESPGIGESGSVIVSGTQGSRGIESLKVEAFEKQFILDQPQLQQLNGFRFNGVQLSYERGYKELGGRTLYLLFSLGFTSGVVERRFVVITESGSVKVGAKVE